jgi:hypothetical protein
VLVGQNVVSVRPYLLILLFTNNVMHNESRNIVIHALTNKDYSLAMTGERKMVSKAKAKETWLIPCQELDDVEKIIVA